MAGRTLRLLRFSHHVAALYPWALGGVVALALCALAFVALWKSQPASCLRNGLAAGDARPGIECSLDGQQSLCRALPLSRLGGILLDGGLGRRPGVGICFLAGAVDGASRCPLAAGLIATLCVLRIITRNRDWRDNITFYTATLAVSPDAYYMHNNLGTVYWAQGNIPAAEKEWRTALRLAPGSEFVLHNLGLVAIRREHYREAEILFLRALAVRPNYRDAHLDLGITYEATGRLREAVGQRRRTRSGPDRCPPGPPRLHGDAPEGQLIVFESWPVGWWATSSCRCRSGPDQGRAGIADGLGERAPRADRRGPRGPHGHGVHGGGDRRPPGPGAGILPDLVDEEVTAVLLGLRAATKHRITRSAFIPTSAT